MALERWKKISEEKLAENPWWSYWVAKFNFKDSQIEYFFMKTIDSVSIFGIDQDGKIPMVKQYRAIFDEFTLSALMGGVEKGQSTEEAVHHEFIQEAQLKAKKIERVGRYHSNNGRIESADHVYVAFDVVKAEAELDITEEFERFRLAPSEIDEKIMSGEITCGMTIAGWKLAKPRVLEIIEQGLNCG